MTTNTAIVAIVVALTALVMLFGLVAAEGWSHDFGCVCDAACRTARARQWEWMNR